MEKTLVLYQSKYGSSQQYAQWLGEALGCPVREAKTVSLAEMQAQEALVYVGSLYAGQIRGFSRIRKQLPALQGKKLALCMVGLTHPSQEAVYQECFEANVPQPYRQGIKPFALQGDLRFSAMGPLHRLMMRMPRALAEKKPPEQRTAEDRMLVEAFGTDAILASREALAPVVAFMTGANG